MIIHLKTPSEIEGFRNAGKEAARILRILFEKAKIGTTTADLDAVARNECEGIGAVPTFLNYNGFPAALCASVNRTMVHGIPDSRKLRMGDLLSLDLGVTLDGFIGDVAATVKIDWEDWPGDDGSFFGSQKNSFLPIEPDLVVACRKALHEAIRKAVPGNRLSDISGEISGIAGAFGFSTPVQYGGHGINRHTLHAQPFIPNDPHLMEEDITLRPGMVLAVEPMFIDSKSNRVEVLADGWSVVAQGNCAHFEHTIAVTNGNPLILTEE